MENDLDHPDLFLRGAAILTLKKSLANQSLDYAALNRTIATKKLDLMLKSSRIDEISVGLDILGEEQALEAVERALPFLSHESVLVKRAAAKCISMQADKKISRHAPRLIEELEAARDNLFRLHWPVSISVQMKDAARRRSSRKWALRPFLCCWL